MAVSRAHLLYHLLIVGIISSTLLSKARIIYLRAKPETIIGSVLGGVLRARVEGTIAITEED